MRIKLDIPANPVQGDATPWRSTFLLFPKQVENQIVWLETVKCRKIFLIKQRATKAGTITAGAWEREWKLPENV
jgi:hypothetical protein